MSEKTMEIIVDGITRAVDGMTNISCAVVKAETIKTETEEQKRIKELELKVSNMQAQIDRLSQDVQSAKSGWSL
ncbi:hypothetical protein WMR74_004334 [Providencia rettgeri]